MVNNNLNFKEFHVSLEEERLTLLRIEMMSDQLFNRLRFVADSAFILLEELYAL